MPINKDKKANVSIVLKKEVHEQLKILADNDQRSVSSLISIIIDKYLKEVNI